MQPDDELCLCFHVTRRKVEQYLRVQRPPVASALSRCQGAGTGCGWCRPLLKQLHQQWCGQDASPPTADECRLPDAASYREARRRYRARRTAADDVAPADGCPQPPPPAER